MSRAKHAKHAKYSHVFLGVLGVLGANMLFAFRAHADQYRSEVRAPEEAEKQAQPVDELKLLQSTTDPYAKALLLRDLAAKAAQGKDYAAAAQYLEQALAQKSLSGYAVEQMQNDLAQLYIATGRYKDTIATLESTVKNNPKALPDQQVALAAAYVQLKRYKEAAPLLQRAVAATSNPDKSWLAALLVALQGTGQEKEQLPVLEQLVRVDPARRDYWLRLAALQLKYGSKERALAVMELAGRQGYLQSPEERLQLIVLTAQLGAPFAAGSLMQTWMDSGALPPSPQNWHMLGTVWLNARESGLALMALIQALKGAPSPQLYLQIGQLQMDRGAYAEAVKAFEAGIAGSAKSGPVFMSLGLSYYQLADVDNALRAFRSATEDPQSRTLAGQWVRYLESDRVREQVLAMAAQTKPPKPRADEQVRLSSRLTGESVHVVAGTPDTSGTAMAFAAPARSAAISGYTPIGAERGGNADGSIPAWEGGLLKAQWPAAYKPGGRLADPYPNDKPLFVITAANMQQYATRLSDGHKALLKRYPDYQMPVYVSRRSASYPQAIYDATQANIGKAKLIGSDALTGAHLGFPFPKPDNGVEILWNHRVRYRGDSVMMQSTQAVVSEGRGKTWLKQTEHVYYRYANLKDPVDIDRQNILLYHLTWFSGHSLYTGLLALTHETANSIKNSRDIWVRPPRMDRMFRLPAVGYDQPFIGSEALMFVDMIDMYNGAFDRYVWKLIGKRELYIPYNAYRISDGRYTYEQLLGARHFNQEAARYELHRVWMIEATLRPGERHSFGKRVFYVDEDTWNVVLVENYDPKGNPWRFQEGHLLPQYDIQSSNCLPALTYDLKDGRYFVNHLIGQDLPPKYDVPGVDSKAFMPLVVQNKHPG